VHQIQPGVYLWEAPNGRLYMATPDGNLIQTADGLDPGPPPGHVRAALNTPDDTQTLSATGDLGSPGQAPAGFSVPAPAHRVRRRAP